MIDFLIFVIVSVVVGLLVLLLVGVALAYCWEELSR